MSQTTEKKPIGIKQVKAMLQEGKSRKEIAEHYGRSQAEMNATVWQHPELKGLKAKKIHHVDIVEDEDAIEQTDAAAPVAEATQEQEEVPAGDDTTSTWNQPANDQAGSQD